MRNMRIIIVIYILLLANISVYAQSCVNNPSVQAGDINPAPLFNGQGGVLSFTYIENLLDYTAEETDPVTLTICLLNIGPVNGVNSVGGTFSSTFDWIYDPISNCLQGTQNQDILGGTGGSITVAFEQTNAIECPDNQMGFRANIQPAGCMNGVNQTNDDSEAVYTCNFTGIYAAIELQKNLSVINDINSNGVTDAGDELVYQFKVRNIGDTILNNVTVTDPKVSVTGGPISLAIGSVDSTTFQGTYVITAADVTNGGVENRAFASGTPVDINGDPIDINNDGDFTNDGVSDISDAGTDPDGNRVTDAENVETNNPLNEYSNNSGDSTEDPTTVMFATCTIDAGTLRY